MSVVSPPRLICSSMYPAEQGSNNRRVAEPTPPGSVRDQAEEVVAGEAVSALQERQLDQAGDPDNLPAQPLHQLRRGVGRPSRSEHVVHDQHPVAGVDGVPVDLQNGRPVLQRVFHALGVPRQLALFPDGHESGAEVVRHRRGEDESAGLDTHDLVDVAPAVSDDDQVDHRGERVVVGEERRDVLEDDPLLRKVRDVPDQALDPLQRVEQGWPPFRVQRRRRLDLLPALPFFFFPAGRGRVAPPAEPEALVPAPLPGRATSVAGSSSAISSSAGCGASLRGDSVLSPGRAPRAAARARICWYLGSRSLNRARTGAAMKIEEYAPVATPMNRAKAKSFSVWPPNSSRAPMGRRTTSEVFTDRIRVWFSEVF